MSPLPWMPTKPKRASASSPPGVEIARLAFASAFWMNSRSSGSTPPSSNRTTE